uniref:Uncharacterized protein n=1 Tax=Vitis vinifera TaxID=29760 RepID=A5B801_VITVI|nr:hypothetical protein VITISV_022760 [Vitis vinifera]
MTIEIYAIEVNKTWSLIELPIEKNRGVLAEAAFQRRLCELITARNFADFQHLVEPGKASPTSNTAGCQPITVADGRHLGVTGGCTSGTGGAARRQLLRG